VLKTLGFLFCGRDLSNHIHICLTLAVYQLFENFLQFESTRCAANSASVEARHSVFGDRFSGGTTMAHSYANVFIPDLGLNPQSSDELLDIGIQYSLGRGVERNNVVAHMCFNLAALKGNPAARQYRAELSQEMSAPEIAEAQRQARAWLTVH
jgi:uncharacterized protein